MRAVIEGLVHQTAVLDQRGRILATNAAWRTYAAENGADPERVSEGADYLSVCDEARGPDAPIAREAARGIREVADGTADEFRLEYPCDTPDVAQWFELRVRRFSIAGQDLIITAHEPTTEHRRLRAARVERERYLRLALKGAHAGLWNWDLLQDRIVGAPELFELFGLEPTDESIPFSVLADRIEPECWSRVRRELQSALAEGRTEYEAEFRVRHPTRGVVWLLGRGEIHYNAHRRPMLITGITTDVTERRRIEEALRASEARFRHMADSAPVMIWTTDQSGSCTYLNKPWYDFTEAPPDSGLGYGWLDWIHPDDREATLRQFTEANQRRETFRLDYRLRRADGAWRWAIDTGTPWFGTDRSFLGFIGSTLDITERKEAEEQQRLLMAELNHRVKNTLAVVQSIASQTLQHAGSLQGFAEAFTGRLRALAAAHSLLTQTNWRSARLMSIIRQTLKAHGLTERTVKLTGPDLELPPKQTLGLTLVFHELATNAVKHGALSRPTGRVRIHWHVTDVDRDGRLHLSWREMDGPPITEPAAEGFGLMLIRRSVGYDLRGDVRVEFPQDGLHCEITIPYGKPPETVHP